MTESLDEILKECCKTCGIYRCKNHLDWLRCEKDGCITTWDSRVFLGCPVCLEKEKKQVYRPRLKEILPIRTGHPEELSALFVRCFTRLPTGRSWCEKGVSGLPKRYQLNARELYK